MIQGQRSQPSSDDENSPLLLVDVGYSTSSLGCQCESCDGSVSPPAKTEPPLLEDSVDNNLAFRVDRYQVASQQRVRLVFYMVLVLTYFGATLTLFVANNFDQSYIESTYYLAFHNLEFWGALVFSIAEALVFYMNTGSGLSNKTESSTSTSGLLLNQVALRLVSFNVIATAVATFLFSMNPRAFEVPAHYIEYSAQITITLVDYMFILQGQTTISSSTDNKSEKSCSTVRTGQLLFATLLLTMAIAKFFLYMGCIPTVSLGRERSAHYVEFLGEMMNSVWAYYFTLQRYHSVGLELQRHDIWLRGGDYRQMLLAPCATEQITEELV